MMIESMYYLGDRKAQEKGEAKRQKVEEEHRKVQEKKGALVRKCL